MELYNGDCLEVMRGYPPDSADMILADLPYSATDCEWDNIIPLPPLWEQYKRIVKPNGAIVLFSVQPFTTKLIQSNLKAFRYCWYWKKNNKTGAQLARVQPMRCVEDICVFYDKKPTYNPQGLIELERPIRHDSKKSGIYRHRGNGSIQRYTNYPANLLEFKGCGYGGGKRLHPTQKPVALLEYLIRTYTNEGETVLDNCMGAGSTGEAAQNTGRHFIGIEKDKRYFDIAQKRLRGGEHGSAIDGQTEKEDCSGLCGAGQLPRHS